MKSLSLVIPAYDAEGLLGRIVSRVPVLASAAAESGFELVETIIVDDGSEPPVDPAALPSLQCCPVSVLRNEANRGKGFSVRRGALAAKGEWVLMSDADESVPLSEFPKLAACADAAIACGNRMPGEDERPFIRRFLSRCFNLLAASGMKDTQCGFKLFNMPLMREIFEGLQTERFSFDVELIRKASSAVSVPVAWKGRRRSSLRVWRDAPRMLWDLLKIRLS